MAFFLVSMDSKLGTSSVFLDILGRSIHELHKQLLVVTSFL